MNKKNISTLFFVTLLSSTFTSTCTNRKPKPKKEETRGIIKPEYYRNDDKPLIIKKPLENKVQKRATYLRNIAIIHN